VCKFQFLYCTTLFENLRHSWKWKHDAPRTMTGVAAARELGVGVSNQENRGFPGFLPTSEMQKIWYILIALRENPEVSLVGS